MFWALYCLDELVRGLDHHNSIRDDGFDNINKQVVQALKACAIAPWSALVGFVREVIMYRALGDRIAKVKREKVWTQKDWMWCFFDIFGLAMPGIFMQCMIGMFHWDEILLNFKSYYEVVIEYWFMTWLGEIIVQNFYHKKLHEGTMPLCNDWIRDIHSWHHLSKDSNDWISTWTFHPVDFLIENSTGPIVFLGLKSLITMGWPRVHLGSYLLMSVNQMLVHSCNPYSITIFFPPFDFIMLATISHNLHHSTIYPTKWHWVWPWHHFNYRLRQADINLYNEHFGTNFQFEQIPCHKTVSERISDFGTLHIVEDPKRSQYAHNDEPEISKPKIELGTTNEEEVENEI